MIRGLPAFEPRQSSRSMALAKRIAALGTRINGMNLLPPTQRQNECACANSFPPFSRAGASRETGFKRNHSGKNGGNLKIPVVCFHFSEIRASRNR